MSIWSTFINIKTHGEEHSEAVPGRCGCEDSNEVWLSSSWYGWPLRLTIDNSDENADALLTRDQANQLADELQMWARHDEIGEIRMRREYKDLPGFTTTWDLRDGATGGTATDTVTLDCSCGTSFHGTSTQVLDHLHTRHPEWVAPVPESEDLEHPRG